MVSDNITQSHISHIRWHGDSNSDKSHDVGKDIEDSGRIMSYNIYNMH